MSRILIIYGTTDGHTGKIARMLHGTFESESVPSETADVNEVSPDVHPEEYDGVIVLGSVHAGRHQPALVRWVGVHAYALNLVPGAFLSVCLAVLDKRPEAQREVVAAMDRFVQSTGWRPQIRKPVAGALLYRRYGWLKRWIMKRIVARAGGDTDTSRDYEYTDWNELRAFAREFAARVASSRNPDAGVGGGRPALDRGMLRGITSPAELSRS
jgi:menaquinone-dependent protoporphyrinogen oxidase